MNGYNRFHIPALFCSDFFSAGFTLMPNLILRYSSRLSLSSNNILILLACFYFQQQGKEELKIEDFASLLNVTEKSIKASIETMTNRGLFTVSGNTCDLSGLFEKITDLWAEEKVQAMGDARQEAASTSLQTNPGDIQSPHPHELLQTFEQEFGRALSQMECAKILSWCKDKGYSESVIVEALKRAVLRGVLNLTYIDRILAQWSKMNLRTDQEVKKYEEHFLSSRMTNKNKSQSDRETGIKDRETRIKDKEEKYKDIYLS
jgi:DNA replication protein